MRSEYVIEYSLNPFVGVCESLLGGYTIYSWTSPKMPLNIAGDRAEILAAAWRPGRRPRHWKWKKPKRRSANAK